MQRYPRVADTADKLDDFGNKLCRNCDKPIASGRRHYCSWSCMAVFNRDHNWRHVRSDVLRRDKYICCICEKRFPKSELQVDHTIPVQMGGRLFEKANLRTMCRECHKAKTRLDSSALRWINGSQGKE